MNARANTSSAVPNRALTFFSLSGRYEVAEVTTIEALAVDGACITSCLMGSIQSLIDGLSDPGSQMVANLGDAVKLLYGALYFVEMTDNLFEAIQWKALHNDQGRTSA